MTHDSEDSGNAPTVPTSVVGLAMRTVLAAIEETGNKKTADAIRNAPEGIGKGIGAVINKLMGKRNRGETITEQDRQAIATELANDPHAAQQVVGLAVTAAMQGSTDASQQANILDSYNGIFTLICDLMAEAKTSLALHGFLQGDDCISYWHLAGEHPRFQRHKSLLSPVDLDVYILWNQEPTADSLATMNETIQRNKKSLPQELYNYRKDRGIAKLEDVEEYSIRVKRLATEEELAQEQDKIFGKGFDIPRDVKYMIPTEAATLPPMFESVLAALDVQGRHGRAVAKLAKDILDEKRPHEAKE